MTAGSIAVPQIIPLRFPSGKRKNEISSNTKIEIKTDTKNCNIFYSLNNQKPDPFQKYGPKSTYKYKTPFTLAAGTITIKALAMTQDASNQSLIVTKVFIVYEGNDNDEDIRFPPTTTRSETDKLNMSLSEQFKVRVRTLSRESIRADSSTTQLHPDPSANRLTSPLPDPTLSPIPIPIGTSIPPPLNQSSPVFVPPATVEARQSRNVCLYCSHPRKIDSSTRDAVYCTNCGSELPPLPGTKREAMRMATCPSCRSEQPPNISSNECLVCGTTLVQPPALPSINTHTSAHSEMEAILCLYCGMYNSPNTSTCVTCANPLYTGDSDKGDTHSVPCDTIMHPIAGSTYVMCGMCGRVNVSDARFCDWCGSRPTTSNVDLTCQNCDSSNDWTARHCSQCGYIMKCPLRPEIEEKSKMRMPSGCKFDHLKWIPIADVDTPTEDKCILAQPRSQSTGTQTKGLFYASANTITSKKANEAWQKITKTVSQDRVLQLSSYSPGNGKWRSQVDHICAHFKAHSASSSELQNELDDCQIGKIKKGSVDIDNGNHHMILTVEFAIKDSSARGNISKYSFASTVTNAFERSRRNKSSESSIRRQSSSNTLTRKPSLQRQSTISIKVEDHLLSAEIAADGLGRRDIITNLIEKGANVNRIDTTRGLPLLLLAVSNNHLEAVKVLLEQGADVNILAKKSGNTALHEAAKLGGEEGRDMVTTLLNHGADSNARNKDNLTACEVATKLGHKELLACFASHLGATMLEPLSK